jgi:hypothetical protein
VSGELVLAVAVGRRAREARDDDERAEEAQGAHHVREHDALAPLLGGLGARLREAVVEGAREELLAAVQAARL